MITTFLFDFDGTIANTFPIIFHAFQGIFREYKQQYVSPADIVKMFGPAEDEIIQTHFKDHGNVHSIIERYYELYSTSHDKFVPSQTEINSLLKDIHNDGHSIGVITGKGRRSLDISVGQLFPDIAFDVTIAGDEVNNPKPHPEGILEALAQLCVQPEDAVYIGDSDIDILAGKRANVKTIAVKWFESNGYHRLTLSPNVLLHHFHEFHQQWRTL